MSKFLPGDKVRHKLGSAPPLIVDHVSITGNVCCSFWDTKKNTSVQVEISPDALEKMPPDPGASEATLLARIEALEARVKALEDKGG